MSIRLAAAEAADATVGCCWGWPWGWGAPIKRSSKLPPCSGAALVGGASLAMTDEKNALKCEPGARCCANEPRSFQSVLNSFKSISLSWLTSASCINLAIASGDIAGSMTLHICLH